MTRAAYRGRSRVTVPGKCSLPSDEIELVPVPDGITLVPSRTEHRVVRRGRVVAIDTGAAVAPAELFNVSSVRSEGFDRKSGIAT